MDLRTFRKIDIAVNQINTAIDIYMKGGDRFSVLTLAGAGEEILGRLLERSNQETSLKKNAAALMEIHEIINKKRIQLEDAKHKLNKAKNSIKHLNATEDDNIVMDPAFDAKAMLYRAIENYYALTGELTDKMLAFIEGVNQSINLTGIKRRFVWFLITVLATAGYR